MILNLSDHDVARIMRSVSVTEKMTGGTPQLPGQPRTPIPFQFRRFRLKYALVAGTCAIATRIEYDPVTGGWTDREEFIVYDLVGNYSGIGDYAADGYTYNGKVGHVGAAIHFHDVDRWYIVELLQSGGSETITVTLTENMGATSSQQASATVDADPGTAYVGTGAAESDPVTVHDPQNLFLRALDGAKGKATLAVNASTGVSEWVLVECQQLATVIKFQVNQSTVAYTDATFLVDNILVISPVGGQAPSISSVNNLLGFPAIDDAWGIAFYNGTDWDGIPKAPLEQIDVPTDLRYDGHPNSRFEWKKTQNVLVWQADDEDSNWTDQSPWHSCVHEVIISDLRLDSGEAQQYEETAHVLESFVDSAWDQWNDTTDC